MWLATWILYFSIYVLSTAAQGRKDTALISPMSRLSSARLGSAAAADGSACLVFLRTAADLNSAPVTSCKRNFGVVETVVACPT